MNKFAQINGLSEKYFNDFSQGVGDIDEETMSIMLIIAFDNLKNGGNKCIALKYILCCIGFLNSKKYQNAS